jgi:hypothetical protein
VPGARGETGVLPTLLFSGTVAGGKAAVALALGTDLDAKSAGGYPMPAQVLQNLRVRPASNDLTAEATVRLWQNGKPTGVAVAISAGSTEPCEDLKNALALADGDELQVVVEIPAGQDGRFARFLVTVESVPAP